MFTSALYLSHWNDEKQVYVTEDHLKDLQQHHLDCIRSLYESYNKKLKGKLVTYPEGINIIIIIRALLSAIIKDLKYPVVIICDPKMVCWWNYELCKISNVDVIKYGNNKINLVNNSPCIVIATLEKLKENPLDVDISILIGEGIETLVNKMVFRKIGDASFKIGFSKMEFYQDDELKILWHILKWCNPDLYGKFNEFIEEHKDHLNNLRDPYDDVWHRIDWDLPDGYESEIETDEYKVLLDEWCNKSNFMPKTTTRSRIKSNKRSFEDDQSDKCYKESKKTKNTINITENYVNETINFKQLTVSLKESNLIDTTTTIKNNINNDKVIKNKHSIVVNYNKSDKGNQQFKQIKSTTENNAEKVCKVKTINLINPFVSDKLIKETTKNYSKRSFEYDDTDEYNDTNEYHNVTEYGNINECGDKPIKSKQPFKKSKSTIINEPNVVVEKSQFKNKLIKSKSTSDLNSLKTIFEQDSWVEDFMKDIDVSKLSSESDNPSTSSNLMLYENVKADATEIKDLNRNDIENNVSIKDMDETFNIISKNTKETVNEICDSIRNVFTKNMDVSKILFDSNIQSTSSNLILLKNVKENATEINDLNKTDIENNAFMKDAEETSNVVTKNTKETDSETPNSKENNGFTKNMDASEIFLDKNSKENDDFTGNMFSLTTQLNLFKEFSEDFDDFTTNKSPSPTSLTGKDDEIEDYPILDAIIKGSPLKKAVEKYENMQENVIENRSYCSRERTPSPTVSTLTDKEMEEYPILDAIIKGSPLKKAMEQYKINVMGRNNIDDDFSPFSFKTDLSKKF